MNREKGKNGNKKMVPSSHLLHPCTCFLRHSFMCCCMHSSTYTFCFVIVAAVDYSCAALIVSVLPTLIALLLDLEQACICQLAWSVIEEKAERRIDEERIGNLNMDRFIWFVLVLLYIFCAKF